MSYSFVHNFIHKSYCAQFLYSHSPVGKLLLGTRHAQVKVHLREELTWHQTGASNNKKKKLGMKQQLHHTEYVSI